jgi:peptidyl-dipeptidase A
VRRHLALLGVVIAGSLALAACKRDTPPAPAVPRTPAPQPAGETAEHFIARINRELPALSAELNAAQWLSNTHITADSEQLAAKANQRWLAQLNQWIAQSRRYEHTPMPAQTARALQQLKLLTAMPAPRNPTQLEELTHIASRMEGRYGAGRYCTGDGAAKRCRDIGQLSAVLAHSRDYNAQLEAWQGWHTVSVPMRADYTRFVALVNTGAHDMGYADAGQLWRSGYDMSPAAFATESDRLWGQVKPLYEQLHCYARRQLDARYGKAKGELPGGLLPAHLLGNLWQQDWSNLWDLLAPYPDAGTLDVTAALAQRAQAELAFAQVKKQSNNTGSDAARAFRIERAAQLSSAKLMARDAEDFYVSLGLPKLPDSYWQRSQFIQPLDRDVMCHASAWDMNMQGDVRIKMCITPTEEDYTTVYHELGHVYYDLAYNAQPPLFQNGANDGFHEAIGDTIVLAMTPHYMASKGLVDSPAQTQQVLINAQMRMALSKIAFLPFGLMIDRWRWGVFDGSIKPAEYNKAWWALKARYQGVAPVTPRGEEFFDAGAKYHVPTNTPYTRYFLANILQFQFYKSLCNAAGEKGPLSACSFYGSKAAGDQYWAMLSKGSSQPWPQTLKELTGSSTMDATPLLDYFAPLHAWLKQKNAGQQCGWQVPAT